MRRSEERRRRVADTARDRVIHTPVIFTRLIRKPEKREKDECAKDERPAVHLEVENSSGVILPNRTWELVHRGVVVVRVSPASPMIDTHFRISHDIKRSQWNGPEYLGGGNGHQTDVSVTREIRGGRQ